jgi:hypothetical protein
MGRPGRAVFALAALAAAPSLPAQTQTTFYAAFADGQEAARQGQWKAAAAALERAIQLRPAPAARVIIYGNNLLLDYYPYSLSARCRLELGDPEAAAAWLARAEANGEPAAVREPVARRLPRLKAKPAEARTPEAPAEARTPVASAEASAPPAPAPAYPAPPQAPPPGPAGPPPPAEPVAPEFIAQPPAVPEPVSRPRSPAGAGVVPGPAAGAYPVAPAAGSLPPIEPAGNHQAPAPDPIRPLTPAFWLVLGSGLAGTLLGQAWKRVRQRGAGPGAAAADAGIPPQVGPYEIVRRLGAGAFAATYLARDPGSGREVALKVLHPHHLQDHEYRRRFGREARICAGLEHPGLARLVDSGPGDEPGWIAFEYVPGPTLDEHLRREGPQSPVRAAAIALGIAEALAYVHTRGVVHRDLKPANVILGPAGPKLMDLGIARELDASGQTTLGGFLGTPRYAAPEAQHTAEAGPAADRYSLGAILFEMVTGRPVFAGETPFAVLEMHRSAPIPDIQAIREVPANLARLIARLLEKEPDRRPEDGELLTKLRMCVSSGEDP